MRTEFSSGQVSYYEDVGGEERVVRIRRTDGSIINRACCRWLWIRGWIQMRAIALHWQERTQMRVCAPGGAGRAADHEAFSGDFLA